MIKKGDALRGIWRELYVPRLNSIFEEYNSAGIKVMPDEAMEMLEEILAKVIETEAGAESGDTPSGLRFDFAAFRREAHHYAVDQFYRIYHGSKKGAPPLSINYLGRVLELRKQGLNNSQIAKKLGQNKDAIRKQVKAAHALLETKVRNIREISKRLPPQGKD